MPIQFRCTGCRQKLSISRRKAGEVVSCPACATELQVPSVDELPDEAQGEPPGNEMEEPEEERQLAAGEPFESPSADVYEDPDTDEEAATFERRRPAAGSGRDHENDAIEASTSAGPLVTSRAAGTPGRESDEEEDDEEEGFRLTRRHTEEGGLDMTPMVDVTFLLLIFFMITASFSIQKSMEAEPPEPDDDGAAQMPSMDDLADDSVIVEIDENDVIYVDDTQVASIPELTDLLALKVASEQKLEMIIEPHRQAKHGTVVQVTDAGIEVGMQRIRRVTQKGE